MHKPLPELAARPPAEEEAGAWAPRGPAAQAGATRAAGPATMALGPEGLALESGEGTGGAGTGGTDREVLTPRVVRRCSPAALGDGEETLHPGGMWWPFGVPCAPQEVLRGVRRPLVWVEGSGQVGSGLGPPGYP